jgi:hypothetical protein
MQNPKSCWACRLGVLLLAVALVAALLGGVAAAGAAGAAVAGVATFFGTTAGAVTSMLSALAGLSVPAVAYFICCKLGNVCCD